MTPSSASRPSAWLHAKPLTWIGFTTLLIGLGISAYWQLFTTFRFWDDEGYLLISLRNFASGGQLYTDVSSQYGPAFNLFFAFLHRFCGLPLDSDGARWVALVSWIGASGFSAVLVGQMTRSRIWAAVGATVAFIILRALANEPLHPVGSVAFVLTGGTAWMISALLESRNSRAWIIGSATGTLLALIKINVGLFYLAGLGVIVLWSAEGVARRRSAQVVLVALAVAAGMVLMNGLRHERWVVMYMAAYAVTAVTTLAVVGRLCAGSDRLWPSLRSCILASAGVAAATATCALVAGIGPTAIWEGVIAGPLRHPTIFWYPFRWSGLTGPLLAMNLAGFGFWFYRRERNPRMATVLVITFRFAVAAGLLISFYHSFAVSITGYLMSFGWGFLWCLAVPLKREPASASRARHALAAVALLQVLHAYPVAGTQVNLGTLLLALFVMIGLAEVAAFCDLKGLQSINRGITVAAVLFPLWAIGIATKEAYARYSRAGTAVLADSQLHLSPWQHSTLSVLIENARFHGDVLFSLPGMFSFNVWTKLPTPTLANITQWWSLLSSARQADIQSKLSAAKRPVIIVQRYSITSGFAGHVYRQTPLTRFIESDFEPILTLDSYELWIRRGQTTASLAIARAKEGSSWNEFSFFLPPEHPLDRTAPTRLEWRDFQREHPAEKVGIVREFVLTARSSHPTRLTEWICQNSGLSLPAGSFPDLLIFKDAQDQTIAEVRCERPKPQANPH